MPSRLMKFLGILCIVVYCAQYTVQYTLNVCASKILL